MLIYVYLYSNIQFALFISILTIFQRTLLKVIITQPPKWGYMIRLQGGGVKIKRKSDIRKFIG